jgi:hypothetical protein
MTWVLTGYLLDGQLDNRTAGRITGWLRFAGLKDNVTLDLQGDFEPDIRGKRISLKGVYPGKEASAVEYMKYFDERQTGKAGHITAGWPPYPWTDYPYIEWYSDTNDRVVLYLEPHQIAIVDETGAVLAEAPDVI